MEGARRCGRPFFSTSASCQIGKENLNRAVFWWNRRWNVFVACQDYERSCLMTIWKARAAIGLMVLGSVLLGTPALAFEPDVDSFAGPELPALHTDQSGAILDPENLGADPSVAPDVVVNEPATPIEH
jgi:hypothetical protein